MYIQSVLNIYDEQTENDPIVPDSLTSFNEPANQRNFDLRPRNPQPQFQMQNFAPGLTEKFFTQPTPSASRSVPLSPDGPDMPQLLFTPHVKGPRPMVANYFKQLTNTPRGSSSSSASGLQALLSF